MPCAHVTHVGAPAVLDVPGLHLVQTPAPVFDEKPAGQRLQTAGDVAFSVALDVPAGHAEHAEFDVLPWLPLYVPAGHDVQKGCPGEGLNVPAAHNVHADEPLVEYEPAAHVKHTDEDVLPMFEL